MSAGKELTALDIEVLARAKVRARHEETRRRMRHRLLVMFGAEEASKKEAARRAILDAIEPHLLAKKPLPAGGLARKKRLNKGN